MATLRTLPPPARCHRLNSLPWIRVTGLACAIGVAQGAVPVFTSHPSPQTPVVGQNVAFVAVAMSESPIQYQWRLNDTDLPGQTSPSLHLFCVSAAQTGQVFTVRATNADGSTVSNPASLTVTTPLGRPRTFSATADPSFTHEVFSPGSYRSAVGSSFEVTVIDSSLGGLWGTDIYTDDSSINAAAIHTGLLAAGERGAVRLQIRGPQSQFPGSTRNAITSNSYGSWGGSFELLGRAPHITRHPASQARMVGGTATFEVSVAGGPPPSYQWHFNGQPLPDATGPKLTVPVTSEAVAGTYVCRVSQDGLGSATSAYAVLGVKPATPEPPQSAASSVTTLPVGGVVRIPITGSQTGGVLHGSGFYHLSSDLARAAVHAGLLANGEAGAVAVVRVPDQPGFRAEEANGVTSTPFAAPAPAFAFLARVPRVVKDPIPVALLPGSSQVLSFVAEFPGSYTIQWRRNGIALDGQTGPTLLVTPEAPGTTSHYDAVLTAPGAPTVTAQARVATPDPVNGRVFSTTSASQATGYLGTPGTVVFVTVQGSSSGGGLWGTDVYTSDSNLGLLAVHSGLLAPGETGQIALYSLGTWPAFSGSTRNGVTSQSWGSFPAITLAAAPSGPVQPAVSVTAAGELRISGVAGRIAQIWTTPSFLPNSWTPLATIFIPQSPYSWTDPTTPRPLHRFYRIVTP